MIVVLDTTVFGSDYDCAGAAWRVLAQAVPAWGLEIYVPEVVFVETVAGYRREILEAMAAVSGWHAKRGGRLGISSIFDQTVSSLAEAIEGFPKVLRQTLDDVGATVISPPVVDHMVLVEGAAGRRKPCNNNGDGYRDTLNWLTVLALAEEHPDKRIFWVSNNSQDFANEDKSGFDESLGQELKELNVAGSVRWFATLQDLVLSIAAEHTPEDSSDLDEIRQMLTSAVLNAFLRENVLPAHVDFPVSPADCALPMGTKNARLAAVNGLRGLTIDVRAEVGVDSSIVAFSFEADAEVLVDIRAELVADDPHIALVSTEGDLATGIVSKRLRFEGLVTTSKLGVPVDGDLQRVRALDDDPGLAAWKAARSARARLTAADLSSMLPAFSPELMKSIQGLAISPEVMRAVQGFTVSPHVLAAIKMPIMPAGFLQQWLSNMPNLDAILPATRLFNLPQVMVPPNWALLNFPWGTTQAKQGSTEDELDEDDDLEEDQGLFKDD